MAIVIDSPGRLGPLLALCWRSVQVLPQQEFDQEGQLLTNAGFTLQTTTPGGRVRIARTELHLYGMPGKGQDRRTQSQGSMW